MYNSLTFYYSNSDLNEGLHDQTFTLNSLWQLQTSTPWLEKEHFQHQQWTTTITHDYESSYASEVQAFVSSKPALSVFETLGLDFAVVLMNSSKLLYSQLTICENRSMFPGLLHHRLLSLKFQPLGYQKCTANLVKSGVSVNSELKLLLARFVAWFKFSKSYLSFYVRKINLEEDGRMSDTFSNRLVCHWLSNKSFMSSMDGVYVPFMEPTQSEVYKHLNHLKERIQRMKAMSQFDLISTLNSIINYWVLVWGLYMRGSILIYCEVRLKRLLQRWAKRRHPNKGWGWVCHKYWRGAPSSKRYVFWLWMLRNLSPFSKKCVDSSVKSSLVNVCQTALNECTHLESTSFMNWQFFCNDSKEVLIPYTVLPFKKWRKSRSFEYFLLY